MKKSILLFTCWLLTSAFSVPCIYFCTDQTRIQTGYVNARDDCREYAELKAELSTQRYDAQQRKTRLVALFSECMGTKGWTVPGPTAELKDKEPPPLYQTTVSSAAVAATDTRRAADCTFARQSENTSASASQAARMCDEECIQGMAQGASPLPAACPQPESDRMARLKRDPRLNAALPQKVKTKSLDAPKKKRKSTTKKRSTPAKSVEKSCDIETDPKPVPNPLKKGTPESVLERGLHTP